VTRIIAVIVTYNRCEKLPTVIDHVLEQTRTPDGVLVVDNASTDGTQDVLARYAGDKRVEVLALPENTGGAGGFASGMARAY
jgi:GT2 family glycosyltransferase